MDDNSETTDFLWNTLSRIDNYISATNSKAGLMLAFNTFLLGGFLLKARDYLTPLEADWACVSGTVLICAIGVACLISLLMTVSIVQPLLDSNKRPGEYHSRVFFGDIAQVKDAEAFAEQTSAATALEMQADLAQQVHVVAQIADRKFKRLRLVAQIAMFAQCPILLALLVLNLIATAQGPIQ